MRRRNDMFQSKYDWDDGVWRAEVLDLNGRLLACKKFTASEDADGALVDIRRRLVEAPEGNTVKVLVAWADWVRLGLAEEGENRWRKGQG